MKIVRSLTLAAIVAFAGGASLVAPRHAEAQTIRAQLVASGLSQPVGVYYPPGDTGRLFIVEQVGTIRILTLSNNQVSAAPFLNIGPSGLNLTTASGERGLLGLAFDPNYATNGRFYVNYTNINSGATFIDRFTVNGTPATATSTNNASRTTLLTWSRPRSNHNGGAIAFGPDGMLYIGAGDSGGANDPDNTAINLDSLQGKILRLDVNDSSGGDGDGFYVPDDNPFRAAGGNIRPYIWAYGVRNPWRLTFDRGTGDLYIGDVGQDAREEINWQAAYVPGPGGNFAQVAGRHYGWDCREGFIAAPGGGACDPNASGVYTNPIKDYMHGAPDNACSITGGHVYRGTAIPELVGAYVVADFCGNWVRSFRNVGGSAADLRDWTAQINASGTFANSLVAINDDGSGELYLVNIGGTIAKIVPLSTATCGTPCPEPVNALATLFFDDGESDQGWTTSRGAGATDGDWQRGVPVPALNGYANNPPFASGGSGSAWVTDNTDPATGTTTSDVDGGSVLLTSRAIDASSGQLTICFDYFLSATQLGGIDPDGLFLEVSGNGLAGPFIRVLSITTPASGECVWTTATVSSALLSTFGINNPSDLRLRFVASDNTSPNQSITEAGIDNIRVTTANPPPDCNDNGTADSADIAGGTSLDCNNNSVPDECDIASSVAAAILAGDDNLRIDLDGGPVGVRGDGATLFGSTCAGCHAADGTGATGPNIRNRDRFFIRERIVFGRPAPHPGGGFPSYTPQNFADIEAFLADGGSKGRPDGIIDSCQATLADCDNDSISDGRELQLNTQADADYDGIPDACECPCDISGGGLGVQDIFDYLAEYFSNGPRADFNGVGGVTVQDIFDFLACYFAGCP